jgi:ethanolamine-phosphate cytidylyltransferase
MPQDERYEALKANKFVSEVILNAPYDLSQEWVDELVEKHNITFVVHGDDPCITADGKDAYAYAKSIGRFKLIKRTEGVSTTDIVGRMLLMSREHHIKTTAQSSFLPTSRRITQFSSGRVPKEGDTIVYIAGSWDLFNVGHVKALEAAKKFGDFLYVGIHADEDVNKLQGGGFPILNLHERTLSVLSNKFVDEVVIGAPLIITEDLIKSMNIHVVVKGTVSSGDTDVIDEALAVPRAMGILQVFESPTTLRVTDIIDRIMGQRETFLKRYEKKSKTEAEYYRSDKAYHAEA